MTVGRRDVDAGRRLCFFSSDSYGLAHVVRNTRIANRVVTRDEDTTALIVSGVAMDQFPPLADGCDYLRMPAILRLSDGDHRSVSMRMPYEELRELRSVLLEETVRRFGASVLVMDHLSRNIRTEIQLTLESLTEQASRPARVLAFNDILNHPDVVERQWLDTGLFDFAATHFDEVWVYGEQSMYDWHARYRMPPAFARKVRYMGYLSDAVTPADAARQAAEMRAQRGLDDDRRVVLLTGGGGHDGGELVMRYMDAVESGLLDDVYSIVVSGPLMAPEELAAIHARVGTIGPERMELYEFVPDLDTLFPAVDAVISMGGCTVTEILAAGTPSVIVPRGQWASSQQVRAELMAQQGWVRLLPLERADPVAFDEMLQKVLDDGHLAVPLPFRGLQRTSDRLFELMGRG
jgi:predicted glycosyltransferase